MNIGLWVVQVLLASMMVMAGVMKTFMPVDELLKNGINYAADLPYFLLRFIGVSELLGAFGLILPSLTRIQPRLTVWAALGFCTIQILAIAFHASRGELLKVLPMNLVFLAMAAFIAWGRSKKAPIESK
jgi:uncharacterized membrane protein YphA (DoxX/SURF4 family)